MSKERFLTLVDAIIAIIATIMVLDLPRPHTASLAALGEIALPFFAYLLSFMMIWSVWYNHHQLFKDVKTINVRIYWWTGLWIFAMSLFPWSTAYVGAEPNEILPELLYLIVIFLWSASYNLTEHELIRENPHIKTIVRPYGGRYRLISAFVLLSSFVVVWFYPMYVLLTVLFFAVMALGMQLSYGRRENLGN